MEIKLKPVNASEELFAQLEAKGLIQRLKPTKKILENHKTQGMVDLIYSSSPEYGAHKLICVGLSHDSTQISLNSHPDNEEFIIMDSTRSCFAPLYIIISQHKHRELEEKARNKQLGSEDFVAVRLKYNDPYTSIFTMLKDVPHCEITEKKDGTPPIFFVTEPAQLTMNYPDLSGFQLKLDGKFSLLSLFE
ncbi:MAG: hypothetical protein ABIG46_06375 [Candidatus Omnitrophota bacterium]|nr:hypothetical protein [Candidatus Omnitrophota bacterium]